MSTEVAEFLQGFITGKNGLLFETRNSTPYLHNNLEQRWLTPRLRAMGIELGAILGSLPASASSRIGLIDLPRPEKTHGCSNRIHCCVHLSLELFRPRLTPTTWHIRSIPKLPCSGRHCYALKWTR